jgi:hypothetical protein
VSYRIPSKLRAEELCADVTRRLGHNNARYVVERYTDCNQPVRDHVDPNVIHFGWDWGVRREFRYDDGPDLGWINGGYVWFLDH